MERVIDTMMMAFAIVGMMLTKLGLLDDAVMLALPQSVKQHSVTELWERDIAPGALVLTAHMAPVYLASADPAAAQASLG